MEFYFNLKQLKLLCYESLKEGEDNKVQREEQILRTTVADRNKVGREKIQGHRL